MMERSNALTNLQQELLKIFSNDLSEHQLMEIKSLLSKYFSEKPLLKWTNYGIKKDGTTILWMNG
jgi:hypothetical protein